MAAFQFNRDYHDLEQVAQYLDAFTARYDEIVASGSYTYNDCFKGKVVGLTAVDDKNEDTAIYLLQGLHRKRAQDARVAELLGAGYEFVTKVEAGKRYRHLLLVPEGRMSGALTEYEDARLVRNPYNGDDTTPYGVLPKGKRTHGALISGRKVLAVAK